MVVIHLNAKSVCLIPHSSKLEFRGYNPFHGQIFIKIQHLASKKILKEYFAKRYSTVSYYSYYDKVIIPHP